MGHGWLSAASSHPIVRIVVILGDLVEMRRNKPALDRDLSEMSLLGESRGAERAQVIFQIIECIGPVEASIKSCSRSWTSLKILKSRAHDKTRPLEAMGF